MYPTQLCSYEAKLSSLKLKSWPKKTLCLAYVTYHATQFVHDKLQYTGKNIGWVFNSKRGCMYPMHLYSYEAKLTNLKLKTWPKQLLGSIRLYIMLSRVCS
jgi:hypothetical protein